MTAGRVGWAVLGVLLMALAVTTGVRNGVAAMTVTVVFTFLPLVRWWPLRTAWIPLAALVAFTVWPLWPPLFGAGLGWLIGIAGVRVFSRVDERAATAEPGRLGMRVLDLDHTPGHVAQRDPAADRIAEPAPAPPKTPHAPGPRAGRASIPKPAPREPGTDAPRGTPAEGPDASSQRAAGTPGAKPESRFPANRTPRAAASPEPKNAAKPRPPARPEPGTGPRPGPAAKPRHGPEPGAGR